MAGTSAVLVLALWLCLQWRDPLEAAAGQDLYIGASPFSGRWGTVPWTSTVVPLAVVVGVVAAAPKLLTRLRWRVLVGVAGLAQVGTTVALAVPDGWVALRGHLTSGNTGYLDNVSLVGSPGAFLAGFAQNIERYRTHARGHPPGLVLVLWVMDRIGLGGAGPAAALVLIGGAVATVSVLVAIRSLAGEAVARRAAPFVVLVPAAAVATNFDLVFSALAAGALCLWVLATASVGQRSTTRAAAAGALFGCTLLGSYGLALFVVPVAAVAAHRRRWKPLIPFGVAAVAVVLLPLGWGFWWFDGLAATRAQYFRGLGTARPGGPFAVLDVVAFAAILGPVTLVALARLRDRRLVPVVAGVGAAVLLALLSQMSKGEVERIWQPFVPWLAVACGALALRVDGGPDGDDGSTAIRSPTRVLLGVQGAGALLLAVFLRSPW